MFWWKSKNKPLVKITLEEINGIETVFITIEKGVSTIKYFDFLNFILGKDALRQACDKLEMNGNKNAFEELKELSIQKYYTDIITIMNQQQLQNLQDTQHDKEVVKPSNGIV